MEKEHFFIIMYEGDFVNGKAEGYGKCIFENGNYYIGQVSNTQRNGKGIMFSKNGEIINDGYFFNDKFEGY